MAALSFDSAYRRVKRAELVPVYYLTGSEDVLKDDLVALILDRAVDPNSRDFNFDMRTAGDLDGETLHTLVETPPLLTERRVVVIKNLEQWRKNAKVWQVLERYVENPSPNTVLILVHGAVEKPHRKLARLAQHFAIDVLSPTQTARWVGKRANRAGFSLTAEAGEHLVGALGGDLSLLAVEIEKLAAVAGEHPLGAEEIVQFVGVRRGETVPDWVGAVLSRNIPGAVEMLETVLATSGMNGVRLVTALGTGLIGVRLARSLLDTGLTRGRVQSAVLERIRAARPPGLRGWNDEAAAWTAAAQHWTSAELDEAIRAAYAADRTLKSTTISDERGILTDMLLKMVTCEVAA